MILKGNRRDGGQKLATQLLNADNNQRIEIVEVRGAVARDLHGAFEEWKRSQARRSAANISTACPSILIHRSAVSPARNISN
jgi:hypothetical protein